MLAVVVLSFVINMLLNFYWIDLRNFWSKVFLGKRPLQNQNIWIIVQGLYVFQNHLQLLQLLLNKFSQSQPASVEVCGVILLFLETKNYCDYQSLKNIVSDRARMVATVLSGKDVAQEVRTDLKRKVRLDFQDLFTHLGRWRRSRTMTPTSSRAWLSYRWASSILSERHWEKYTESNSITHYRHNCLVFIWYISDITGSLKRALYVRNTCNLTVGEEGVRRDFLVSGRFNTFASLILAAGGCSGTTWE